MELHVFLILLLGVSVLTGLCTEAVKAHLIDYGKTYRANTLAGIVSVILSVLIGIGYFVLTGATFTPSLIVYLVALIILSWLCAMVGYDKVVQAIMQFKTNIDKK